MYSEKSQSLSEADEFFNLVHATNFPLVGLSVSHFSSDWLTMIGASQTSGHNFSGVRKKCKKLLLIFLFVDGSKPF